jgi:hypothetical protein
MTVVAAAARTTVPWDHLLSLAHLYGGNDGGCADDGASALSVIPACLLDSNGDSDSDGDGDCDGNGNGDGGGNGDGEGDSDGEGDGNGDNIGDSYDDGKIDGDEDGDGRQMGGSGVRPLLLDSWRKWQQRGQR